MNTSFGYVDEAAIRTDRTRQLASRAEYNPDAIAVNTAGRDLRRCNCGRLTQARTGVCPGCRRKSDAI